ncbi:MAG: hypothetical protein P9M07_08560 [Candidatus Aceula meridiana]|nr:hypothetical protein [Candidatus Aceula meridiana]
MAEYQCPHCGMVISDEDALLCHFCGESLQRAGKGFLGRVKYSSSKVVWFFVIFAVIFSFILLTIF